MTSRKKAQRAAIIQPAPLLTIKDVAAHCQVSPGTVRVWLRTGQIPALKIGRIWRFCQADLDAWFDNQKTTTPRPRA